MVLSRQLIRRSFQAVSPAKVAAPAFQRIPTVNNPYFDQVVTGFSETLKNLSLMLDKAAQHAHEQKFDAVNLLSARLAPDMFTCARQFQLATDFAKGAAARLSGSEPPKWEDTEHTVEELKGRLEKARAFLSTFTPSHFTDAGNRTIELKTPAGNFTFSGETFLLRWAVPNFYFHCTTAYNLLRHNGVPVGKFDFLGQL
jgi:hypothetical protein